MEVISVVNGDYKLTYNWGAPPCKTGDVIGISLGIFLGNSRSFLGHGDCGTYLKTSGTIKLSPAKSMILDKDCPIDVQME